MNLSDRTIRQRMGMGGIVIDPFHEECLGTNSYDVHLARKLQVIRGPIDAAKPTESELAIIPSVGGFVLHPGVLYLGVTREYTETRGLIPDLGGKSSTGRLGLSIHVTAGWGDDGFNGHWTMEMHVIVPLRVYAGMRIGQLRYAECTEADVAYAAKVSQSYQQNGRQEDPEPVTSNLWRKGQWRWHEDGSFDGKPAASWEGP